MRKFCGILGLFILLMVVMVIPSRKADAQKASEIHVGPYTWDTMDVHRTSDRNITYQPDGNTLYISCNIEGGIQADGDLNICFSNDSQIIPADTYPYAIDVSGNLNLSGDKKLTINATERSNEKGFTAINCNGDISVKDLDIDIRISKKSGVWHGGYNYRGIYFDSRLTLNGSSNLKIEDTDAVDASVAGISNNQQSTYFTLAEDWSGSVDINIACNGNDIRGIQVGHIEAKGSGTMQVVCGSATSKWGEAINLVESMTVGESFGNIVLKGLVKCGRADRIKLPASKNIYPQTHFYTVTGDSGPTYTLYEEMIFAPDNDKIAPLYECEIKNLEPGDEGNNLYVCDYSGFGFNGNGDKSYYTVGDSLTSSKVWKRSIENYVSGGSGEYEFSVLRGELPSGITLSASGEFSGTFTAACEKRSVTIRVVDIKTRQSGSMKVFFEDVREKETHIKIREDALSSVVDVQRKVESRVGNGWRYDVSEDALYLTNASLCQIEADDTLIIYISGTNQITCGATDNYAVNVAGSLLFTNVGDEGAELKINQPGYSVNMNTFRAVMAKDITVENCKISVKSEKSYSTKTSGYSLYGIDATNLSLFGSTELNVDVSSEDNGQRTTTAINVSGNLETNESSNLIVKSDSGASCIGIRAGYLYHKSTGTMEITGKTGLTTYLLDVAADTGKIQIYGELSLNNKNGLNLATGKKVTMPENCSVGQVDSTYYLLDGDGNKATYTVIESVVTSPLTFLDTDDLDYAGGILGEDLRAPKTNGIGAVSGGEKPYTFSVESAMIPAGLYFNSNYGEFSGKPTECYEERNITITVTDKSGETATATVKLGAFVEKKKLTGITLSKSETSVVQGESDEVEVSFNPTDASNKSVFVFVNTEDRDVVNAEYDTANNVNKLTLYGKAPGVANVKVQSQETFSIYAECKVYVREKKPTAKFYNGKKAISDLDKSSPYLINGENFTSDADGIITLPETMQNKDISIVKLYTSDTTNPLYEKCASEAQLLTAFRVDLSSAEVTINDISNEVYDGKEKKPSVKISYTTTETGTYELVEGKDYKLTYENNINVGKEAKVTIEGVEPFAGTCTKFFEIEALDISSCDILLDEKSDVAYYYDGAKHEPKVELIKDGVVIPNEEYEIDFTDTDLIEPCTNARVNIVGKNNCKGDTYKTFKILEIPLDVYVKATTVAISDPMPEFSVAVTSSVERFKDFYSLDNIEDVLSKLEYRCSTDNTDVIGKYDVSVTGPERTNHFSFKYYKGSMEVVLEKPTSTPAPTEAPTETPTNTKEPEVTDAPTETPTNTKEPGVTDAPTNTPTNTKEPGVTNAPTNTPTNTKEPGVTNAPTNTPTNTKEPGVTNAPTNAPTITPVPGATEAPKPTTSPSVSSSGSKKNTTKVLIDFVTKSKVKIINEKKAEVTYLSTTNKKAKTVSIPSKVTINGRKYKVVAISDNAFKNNKKVTKIVIPASVKKLGKNIFKGTKKLKTILVKTTKLKKKSVSPKAFAGIAKKTRIKVPKSKRKQYIKLFGKKHVK